MTFRPTRRGFVASAGAASAFIVTGASAQTANKQTTWKAKQYVNQPTSNPLFKSLEAAWAAVREETKGRLDVTVYPQNNGVAGSDPAVLKMLQAGEVEFFALMGGLLSAAVPVMDIQGLPFAFKNLQQVYRSDDGPLGRYLDQECEAKGIHRIKHGLFENGFRQMNMREKEIRTVDDVAGMKIRVPDGEMFRDFFKTMGAEPVSLNINQLYAALKEGRVDGQENPLVVAETNKLYEVTKRVSITNHMWSGFNMIANAKFWASLPRDVRRIVEKHVAINVDKQRKATDDLNIQLETTLVKDRGMTINTADASTFRAKLKGDFYPRWKKQIGTKAWTLLEKEVGKLG
jgi:tripartite ATP-independent transporter DctP family solute receptor